MSVEMADPEGVLMREIPDKRVTQASIALIYAYALRQGADIDWHKVNAAILERWSPSGLERIKRMAWDRLEASSQPTQPQKQDSSPTLEEGR